jgi:hypothetical protein
VARSWQIVALAISLALMIATILWYAKQEEKAPSPAGAGTQPHAGSLHHSAETPDHKGGDLSPIQVFANAKDGDWRAYRVTTEITDKQPITATALLHVSQVGAANVTLSGNGRIDATGEIQKQPEDVRPRQGLTIDQLTGNDIGGWTIYDVAITDEPHEVGGRTFKCKKISYASKDPMFPTKNTRTELWISDEVPAGGIVEEKEIQQLDAMRFAITQTLLGFGDATTTAWGQKPDGL